MENPNLTAKAVEGIKAQNTAINSASSISVTNAATAAATSATAASTATSITINDAKAKADIPTLIPLKPIPPCAAAYAADTNVGVGMLLPSTNGSKKPNNCRERLQLSPFNLMTNTSLDPNINAKDKMDLPEGWVLKQGDLQKLKNPQDLQEIVIFERKITVEASTPSPADATASVSTASVSTANHLTANTSAASVQATSSAITSKDSEKQIKDTKAIQENLTLVQVMLTRKTFDDSKMAPIKISLMFKKPSLVIKGPFDSLYSKIDAIVHAAESYHGFSMPSFDDKNHLYISYRIGDMSELHAKAWFDVLINEGFLKEDAAVFFQALSRDPISATVKEKLTTIANIISNKEFLKYSRAIELAKSLHSVVKSPDQVGNEDLDSTIAYEMGLKLAEDSIENAILSFKIIKANSFLYPLALEQIAVLYMRLSEDTHHTVDERREYLEKALKCYMKLSITYNFNMENKAALQQCISTLVLLIKKHAALAPHESLFNNFNIEAQFSHQKIRHGRGLEPIFEKFNLYLEIFTDLANNIHQSINPSKSTDLLDKKTTQDKNSATAASAAPSASATATTSSSASKEKDSKHAKEQSRTEESFKPYDREECYKQEKASRTFRYSKALILQADPKEKSEQSHLARAVIYKQILGYHDDIQGFVTAGKKSSTLVLLFRKPNNGSLNQNFEQELWDKLNKINGALEWYSCNHLNQSLYFTQEECQQHHAFWAFYIDVGSMTESIAHDFFNGMVSENYITQSEANIFKSKFCFKPNVVTQEEHGAIQAAWNSQQYDEAIKLARQVHQKAIAQNRKDFPWKANLDDAEVAYELGLGLLSAGQPEKAIEAFEILKISSPFYHAAQEQIALANKASNSRESELALVKSSFKKLLADLFLNNAANEESLRFFLEGLEKYAGFNVYDTKKRLYTERFQSDPAEDPLFLGQIILPLSNYLFSLKKTPTPTTAVAAQPHMPAFLPSGGPQAALHASTSMAAAASTKSTDAVPNKYK